MREPRVFSRNTIRRPSTSGGYSLLELVVVLALIAVMGGFLVPLTASLMDTNRNLSTYGELARMYKAITGDPESGTYGYLGDVGKFPDSLMDLVEEPAGSPAGWNGPYLTDVRIVDGALYDAHGAPIECYHKRDSSTAVPALADRFVLISRGADRSSTNTSATPNECATFTGTLPSAGTYPASIGNEDNVVYPQFTDDLGLLDYQHVGRLSVRIFNYDSNPLIRTMVPGCGHLYTITVTSLTRGASDTFSAPFNPGANSFDLPQGLYRLRVTSLLASKALLEEQVAIVAGTTTARELRVGGLDSGGTPDQTFQPTNGIDFPSGQDRVRIWQTTGTEPEYVGQVDLGETGNFTNLNPCAQITVRQNNEVGDIVDSFTYPYLTTAYQRKINFNSAYSLTIVNQNTSELASREQLFVYDTGLLAAVVSGHGSAKARTIMNFKSGNPYSIYDKTGAVVVSATAMPSSNTTVNVP